VKKMLLITTLILLFCGSAMADCDGTITAVYEDPIRPGIVIIESDYSLNGGLVYQGKTRWRNTSGSAAFIKLKVQAEMIAHCEALISRITENKQFIDSQIESIRTQLETQDVTSLIADLQSEVGKKTIKVKSYKIKSGGKIIEVKADKTTTVTDDINP
jgi:hypothetical protein